MENALILLTFDEVRFIKNEWENQTPVYNFFFYYYYQSATYSKRNQIWSLLLGNIPSNLKGTTDNTFYTRKFTLKGDTR
jgi:acid phosphatase